MPRPKRPRHVESHPDITGFTPDGTSAKGETYLSIEEFEAIRLIDYLGLDQSQAAEQMNVSRQTFGRILKQGRYNLSKALVIGKRLRVTGGCFKMRSKRNKKRRDEYSLTDNKEEIMNEQRLTNKGNNKDMGNSAGRGSGQGRGQGQRSGKGQGRGTCQGNGQGSGRGQGSGNCNRGNR